ncbi:MAG: hypothetical protein NT039_00230 [Candidatus Berkelbacteria bacterium]|nr:hypothetical protein [Candidatus Berkelbacteria bacterium]
MLAINHTLVGAAIGSQIDNIPVVVGLAIASHFVLDFLPHVDAGTEIKKGGLRPIVKYFLAMIDIFAALIIITLILFARPHLNREAVIIGALTALLIDIIFCVPIWEPWVEKTWPFSMIYKFHNDIHRPLSKYQYNIGIPLQLAIIAVSIWLLLK